MKSYSFVSEADQINLENPSGNDGFEPLIKSKADIPLSNDQAQKMETVAKIRQIEAKTKEIEAKAKQLEMQGGDPSMGGGIDPMTGMPMPGAGGSYSAVGRAYKLKQIFDYLNTIKCYLRDSTNDDFEKLYKDSNTAFEMFKLLINNLKVYKDKVDDLIIMYYELIKIMTEKIKNTLNERQSKI